MMKKIITTVLAFALFLSICSVNTATIALASENNDVATIVEITEADALQIALKDASFNETSIKYQKTWEDTVDGTAVYKVIFYVGPVEFIYQIDKGTGDIISKVVND